MTTLTRQKHTHSLAYQLVGIIDAWNIQYKQIHPDGWQPSQFCEHYNRWRSKLDVSLRQTYKAGEKMFVDYAGQTVKVSDRHTGLVQEAQIFIAALGASNYTYAEATWDQKLPKSVRSILEQGMDKLPLSDPAVSFCAAVEHDNIRGGKYYH